MLLQQIHIIFIPHDAIYLKKMQPFPFGENQPHNMMLLPPYIIAGAV